MNNQTKTKAGPFNPGFWLALPALAWMVIFLLLPLGLVFAISFFSRGDYGEIQRPLTLENYSRFLGFGPLGFEPLYPFVVLRSLLLGAGTTFFCGLAALPMAFAMARLPKRLKTVALLLVVIPLWTNLLIRTYAWQIILGSEGWLSRIGASWGILSPGEGLYPSTRAVYLAMVCDFLPFFVLPLYASVEKINWNLVEAAKDLGARPWNAFRHSIWPQIVPGAMAGAVLVFLSATGQFIIPDLLGGARTVMIGNAMQQQFGASRDWPFGSAIAALVMMMVLGGVWIQRRNRSGRAVDWL